MIRIDKDRLSSALLVASLTLNVALGFVLLYKIVTAQTMPNVSLAYAAAYRQAENVCHKADQALVDCNQIKLAEIQYQTVERPLWIMNFVANNERNNVQWSGVFFIDPNTNTIHYTQNSTTQCKHFDDFGCQL